MNPRLIENSASNAKNGNEPRLACCPAICAILIGPPSSLRLTCAPLITWPRPSTIERVMRERVIDTPSAAARIAERSPICRCVCNECRACRSRALMAEAVALDRPSSVHGRRVSTRPPRSISTRTGFARTKHDEVLQILEGRMSLAGDRVDPVAGWKPARSAGDAGARPSPTTLASAACRRSRRKRQDQDREQEIGGGPGEHDEESLPDRPHWKGAVALLGGHGAHSSAGLLAGFMSPTNFT